MGGYTIYGWLRLVWEVALTRLTQPGARLIRRPFYLKGGRHVDFGRRITIGRGARIEAYGARGETNIRFGDDVEMNDQVHLAATQGIVIGDRVLIASRVFISDHNHGSYGGGGIRLSHAPRLGAGRGEGFPADHSAPNVPPARRPLASAPVVVGDDVWLGQGVCVLPGVTIGAGSVVGANAVVTTDIPPGSIAVGIPARVVREHRPGTGWVSV